MSSVPTRVRFFATPKAFRAWFLEHHRTERELWVGFWRVATGKPSITWPQSVDQALCFGWIDGLRRGLDEASYAIRFTPRSATSTWSRVNLKRYDELLAEGLVVAEGKAARAKWKRGMKSGYTFETPGAGLDAAGERRLKRDKTAWAFWQAQTPGYRRVAGHWVTSPKRPETRAAHLETLIECCRAGRAIPPLARYVKVKPAPR